MLDLDAKVSCSNCGYDLMGVAREGRCPECGQRYDLALGMGVTKVSANMLAHQRGDKAIYLVKVWGMAFAAVACLGIGGLLSLVSSEPSRPLMLGALIASLFAFGAFVTWFTERK
ncbi:hypothetical protein [Algisphaera agarilytica]|uniref:Uncharacterized protein n=1 Tax=Algisphaera agarilytica TaxID=1385975 RepID=A0A7X0H4E6_9BACT|nr:hypothetical protein [Algisphaera agarilytica]MBB6429087.1 hypothetical protein [Algisphaera agarilytica]